MINISEHHLTGLQNLNMSSRKIEKFKKNQQTAAVIVLSSPHSVFWQGEVFMFMSRRRKK